MDYETKFLDKEYVATRMRDIQEIKSGYVEFKVQDSNRDNSISVYVYLFINGQESGFLRISDHYIKQCKHPQFIVNPCAIITKKRKDLFGKTLANIVKDAKKIQLKILLDNINKQD